MGSYDEEGVLKRQKVIAYNVLILGLFGFWLSFIWIEELQWQKPTNISITKNRNAEPRSRTQEEATCVAA